MSFLSTSVHPLSHLYLYEHFSLNLLRCTFTPHHVPFSPEGISSRGWQLQTKIGEKGTMVSLSYSITHDARPPVFTLIPWTRAAPPSQNLAATEPMVTDMDTIRYSSAPVLLLSHPPCRTLRMVVIKTHRRQDCGPPLRHVAVGKAAPAPAPALNIRGKAIEREPALHGCALHLRKRPHGE